MGGPVDANRADVKRVHDIPAGAHPAQDRGDPEHELLRAERLREVIVRAEFQSADAVGFVLACGQHQDRHAGRVRILPQASEDVEAAHPGEHQVEHDESWALAFREREGIGAGRGGRDAILRLGQMVDDERDDVRLVIDDQNAFRLRGDAGHGVASVSRRRIIATSRSVATAFSPPWGMIRSA